MSDITRYEITARHPDGRTFLIAYSPRKSRIGLLHAVQERGPAIVAALGIPEDTAFGAFQTKPLIHVMAGEWRLGFTGRTQRDAKSEGRHPSVAAPSPAPAE